MEKDMFKVESAKEEIKVYKPSPAFVSASWLSLLVGFVAYLVGLVKSDMALNEQGYYFTVILFGLFSAISVQKSVRDRLEGMFVSDLYYGLSWGTTIISIVLLVVGLWNANLLLSEKGFYGMSFMLTLFAAIAVQKNVRDNQALNKD